MFYSTILTFYLFAALDKLNVTLVTNDDGWKITVTKQLLTELAKDPSVILSGLVPKKSPELKSWAKKLKMNLVLPKKITGFSDKELLSFPPDNLDIDVLIIHSYGTDLGRQAQVIKENRKKCKWVHVVHTISQELAKFGEKEIHNREHELQLELCNLADMILAIGPKVAEFYSSYLLSTGKIVFDLTPGIDDDLINIRSVAGNWKFFRIMVGATYHKKYFEVKGLDIAAQAINLLQDTSYHILFLVRPDEDPQALESRLKIHLDKKTIHCRTIRKEDRQLAKVASSSTASHLAFTGRGFWNKYPACIVC